MAKETTEAQKYDQTYFLFRNETIGGLAYVVLLGFFVVKGLLATPFRLLRRR